MPDPRKRRYVRRGRFFRPTPPTRRLGENPTREQIEAFMECYFAFLIDKGYVRVLERDEDLQPKILQNTDAGRRFYRRENSREADAEFDEWLALQHAEGRFTDILPDD